MAVMAVMANLYLITIDQSGRSSLSPVTWTHTHPYITHGTSVGRPLIHVFFWVLHLALLGCVAGTELDGSDNGEAVNKERRRWERRRGRGEEGEKGEADGEGIRMYGGRKGWSLISYLLTVCQTQTSALLTEDTFTYVDLSTHTGMHAHVHIHTCTHTYSFNHQNRSVYASENSSEWTATKTERTGQSRLR